MVFALTAGVMIGAAYSDHRAAQHKAQQSLTAVREELPKWTDTAGAWFALVLTAATVLQIVLWVNANNTAVLALKESEKANIAASKAANEASRSVDAFIEAERGRMVYIDGLVTPNRQQVLFTFRNIGRSSVALRAISTHFEAVKYGEERPKVDRIERIGQIYIPIEAGGIYSTGGYNGIPLSILKQPINIPDAIHTKMDDEHYLLAVFEIAYATSFGTKYVHRHTVVFEYVMPSQHSLMNPYWHNERQAHPNYMNA